MKKHEKPETGVNVPLRSSNWCDNFSSKGQRSKVKNVIERRKPPKIDERMFLLNYGWRLTLGRLYRPLHTKHSALCIRPSATRRTAAYMSAKRVHAGILASCHDYSGQELTQG